MSLGRFFIFLDRVLPLCMKGIIGIAFTLGVMLYGMLIIGRVVFSVNFLWIPPVIQYLFIVGTLYGGGLASFRNEHIKIDALRRLIQHRLSQAIVTLVSTVVITMIVVLFWQHLRLNFVSKALSEVFLPVWVMDIPFVGLFMAIWYVYLRRSFTVLGHMVRLCMSSSSASN